ncbi:hypothetical protein GGI21_004541, partial [Coemansia aciculifera]
FSIIRSRNPLLCSWNALAVALFYRWHVAGFLPPTFANPLWKDTLVVPVDHSRSSSSLSVALDGGQKNASIVESRLVSATERLSLVRELLPSDRLPME